MKAIEGVLPHSPQIPEVVIAKDQPEYTPLPIVQVRYDNGDISMVSCYELTIKERIKLLFSGKLWIEQMTFGQRLQPQRPTLNEPLTASDN